MDFFGCYTVFTSILLLLQFLPTSYADCYSLNGLLATQSEAFRGAAELVSCGNGTNNCCLKNERCGSNLLCLNTEGVFARQYCAVKSWANCSALAPGYVGAGVGLEDCGSNVFTFGGNWDCKTGPLYFVDPGTGEVHNASTRSSTAPVTYWKANSASILAQSTSLVSSVTSSTTASASATGAEITPSGNPTVTSMPVPPTQNSSSSELSAGTGAGIGIGCAAAVAGILLSTWLWRRERRKRRMLQEQIQRPPTLPTSPPMYQLQPAPKAVYAHTHTRNQGSTPELPPQELEDRSRNEVP